MGGIPGKLIRVLTIFYVAGRDFVADKCGVRSSALTFYSTLSLVPILALLFGIAKGFGFEDRLKRNIVESADQNQEIFLKMFEFAENTLRNARGGVVAGIGVIILVYTLLRTISLVEDSFNDIWEVKKARTWVRKFTDYLSITLLAPFLLIFSSSVTVFVSSNVQEVAQKIGIESVVGPLLEFGLELTPYILIWILFLGVYMIMPNKKVNFSSGLFAAVVAGSLYQVVEWVYIGFQIGVSKYNAIYGSFAALPLFLIWVQTSWNIVLFGAELSYAFQNLDELLLEKKNKQPSPIQKLKLSLLVMKALVQHYSDKVPFISASQIAAEADIPLHKTHNILYDLEQCNLVVSTDDAEENHLYQPARDADQLNVSFVIESLIGEEGEKLEGHPEMDHLLEGLKKDILISTGNKRVAEI